MQYMVHSLELAGSLGDLGTLLPLAIGMILINGLNPLGVFFSIGLFYIVSGIYYGVTVPVQPMKVIGAYAVATAISPSEILASGVLIGLHRAHVRRAISRACLLGPLIARSSSRPDAP